MGLKKERVACFIDGFNLYHSINDLKKNHLKWLDLQHLMKVFCDPSRHDIISIWYFSAFATWLPAAYKRHREYVKALPLVGVKPVMGRFKSKDRQCKKCGIKWVAHEEKESDVNIALWVLGGAYRDEFDRAHIVTADSDLAPAVGSLKKYFPQKHFRILLPPNRTCYDLAHAAGKKSVSKILPLHICADPPHRSGYQVTSKSRDQRRFSDSERVTQAKSMRG